MKPHKHDWHCGRIERAISETGIHVNMSSIILSLWACSICGAVKELKSKEVVKE